MHSHTPGVHPISRHGLPPSPCPLQVCAARTFNVLPVVEHVFDMGNLAAICRSADALGFGAVHVVRNVADTRYKQSKRASAGADKWLDVQVGVSPSWWWVVVRGGWWVGG